MSKVQKDPEQNETKYLRRVADINGKRVLEIGCGEGRLTWRYAGASLSTIGLDPDKDAVRVASADRPRDLTGKIHFAAAQAEYLPFQKETFDITILAWSL
jgi:ubiquinone/menaquinone biosynthesis C-methylase UbiE